MSGQQNKSEIQLTTFHVASVSRNVPCVSGASEKPPLETSVKEGVVNSVGDVDLASVKSKWTWQLGYCSFTAVIGSTFIIPYNAVVINVPELILKQFVNESFYEQFREYPSTDELDLLWSWTVSLFLIGGLIGAFLGGAQSNLFGRRRAVLINSVIGVISGVLMFTAPFVNLFELLMVGRFIAGIQCGAVSAIVPAYLTELAPLSLRGATATMNQLSLSCGGTFAAFVGLPILLGRDHPIVWPFLFFPCIALPGLQILLVIFCVESPLWMMTVKRDESETFKAIKKLRERDLPREVIEAEVAYLRSERDAQDALPKLTCWERLRGSLTWTLVICVVLQLGQQASGFSAVIYYSTAIFANIFERPIPEYLTLGIPGISVIVSVVGIFVVEWAGRRSLMLFGFIGMLASCISINVFLLLSHVSVAFDYLTIAIFFIFSAIFAVGPASIPWYIASELTLPPYRPPTIAICTFVNWSGQVALGLGFPPLQKAVGAYSFLVFGGMVACSLVFTLFFLPETKGLHVEEVIHRLSVRKIQLNCGLCRASADTDQSASDPSVQS